MYTQELDKTLNRKSDFEHPTIDPEQQIRLLRFPCYKEEGIWQPAELFYSLETVSLAHLSQTHYRALSYTWGHTECMNDVQEIFVDGQSFWIRRNLFDFLAAAAARGEDGLFFIDAICINQLHLAERQAQVQEMARIYRNADEVIAWLGMPDMAQLGNVYTLSQTKGRSGCDSNCASWTMSQWAGFRYLSHHIFWSRMWIVQEVLLASSMVVWCGSFTFPLSLFGGISGTLPPVKVKFDANGRPSTTRSAGSRLQSPAACTITHRLRHVPKPIKDPMAQGTKIGTIEEMSKDLRLPLDVMTTYQSQTPDLLYQAVRKFGKLECSDPRDRLYGLLGILNERSRAQVKADYTQDISYAYYQALKIGLQELQFQNYWEVSLFNRNNEDYGALAYFCDVRDAFGIEDGQSLSILQRVLGELGFQSRRQAAIAEVQLQQQLQWRDTTIELNPSFDELLKYGQLQEDPTASEGWLFKFHTRQYRMLKSL
jgi:hypothetical protein